MSIYVKLANIQKELIAPKEQRNDFGKYNYRTCEDILKALKPLCDKYQCCVFINNSMEQIADRVYVKADVTLVDLESAEQIKVTAHAREEDSKKGMDGSQITGASISYARKYALAGLFCIDNEKDSDATNVGDKPSNKTNETAEARTELLKYVNDCHMSAENIGKICAHYKVKKLADMSIEQCKDYLNKARSNK